MKVLVRRDYFTQSARNQQNTISNHFLSMKGYASCNIALVTRLRVRYWHSLQQHNSL